MLADSLRERAVIVEDVVETGGLRGGLDGVDRVEGSSGAKELALELEVGVEETESVALRVEKKVSWRMRREGPSPLTVMSNSVDWV